MRDGIEQKGRSNDQAPKRVLIVEPDPSSAMLLHDLCVAEGLEPKICLGAVYHRDCPGASEGSCPKNVHADAVFVAISERWERRIVPSCIGDSRSVVACPIGLGSARRELFGLADLLMDHPYDPEDVAEAITVVTSRPH